jgi:acyl-coenzyme A synthetase/AMP-(fatty) acid ligase
MSLSSQKYGVWDMGSGKTYFGVKKAFLDPDPQHWINLTKTHRWYLLCTSPVTILHV